jgi:signal transduction histidine kinase
MRTATPESRRAHGETGFNAASWAVLGVALLIFALSLAHTFYRLSLPSDGWFRSGNQNEGEPYTFDDHPTGTPSPLQKGDVLLAIEDQPFEAIRTRAFTLQSQRPSNWAVGHVVRYTVLRAGRTLAFDVPLGPEPAPLAFSRPDVYTVASLLFMLLCALLVFILRPRNHAARLLFLFFTLISSGSFPARPADMLDRVAYWPGAFLNLWIWLVIGSILMHLVLVFPAPKAFLRRHPRRWLAAIYGLMPGAFLLALGLIAGGTQTFWATFDVLNLIWAIVATLTMILSLGHAFLTVRSPVERAQLRWVAFGLLVGLGGGGFASYLLQVWVFGESAFLQTLGNILVFAFPLSLAIAILRYRLWDIDILLNRTLVYGALTACVVGLYALVVGYLSQLFQTSGSFLISIVATGLVAILFQPLRERLQRGVNRLMYGERDDPYAVISHLGRRMEDTLAPEAMLPTLVETVAQALKLPYVAIALATTDDRRPTTDDRRPTTDDRQATTSDSAFDLRPSSAEEGFRVVAASGNPVTDLLRLPLAYQGETIGQLLLAPRAAGEAFSPADRRLLEDLARQAGVAAHAVRLTADLQRSRERLVTTREEERRRLRRDLHDGLGPTLASLAQRIDTARGLVPRDPDAATALLSDLKTQIKATIAEIRRVAYALRPPALDELGLVPALREHAAHFDQANGLRVSLEVPEELSLLPAAVEVAAYRIVLEALTNVARHAHAQSCRISLSLADGLCLEIIDDGSGLPVDCRAGVGLTAMRERAAELGGVCRIEPGATGGTHVWARLPLPSAERRA